MTTVRRQNIRKNHTKSRLLFFACLAALLLFAAAAAEHLCPYDPYAQDYASALCPPSPAHPFGTDRYGRDMLSRVIMGAKTSVFSSLVLVLILSVFGTCAGIVCGYLGGWVDTVIMRISDLCLAFPGLVFAMGHTDFMDAARLAGGRPLGMIRRHILPNILGPILVTAALDIGAMMMELAGLSFLGLGAMPPTAEWGSMMSNGRSMLQTYPWVVMAPGAAIFVTAAIFNLFGDALRDYLDPKNR